jgi:transcription-repair coupling factor (superfamily II helicase)
MGQAARTAEQTLLAAVRSSPGYAECLERIRRGAPSTRLSGLAGSAGAGVMASLLEDVPGQILLFVASTPAEAGQAQADLEQLLGPETTVLFPEREALPHEEGEPHLEIGGLRVEAVEALFAGRARAVVATLRAVQERAPLPSHLSEMHLDLAVGMERPLGDLMATLQDRGFERAAMVEEVGQFAVRGGILDVFSFGSPDPVRIEFWGDEIVSLRLFDILDQRSVREVPSVHLLPVDFKQREDGEDGMLDQRSLLELLPRDALLVSTARSQWEATLDRTWSRAREFAQDLAAHGETPHPPGDLLLPPAQALSLLEEFRLLELDDSSTQAPSLEAEPPPAIERDMDRLSAVLREGAAKGRNTLLLCDNEGQLDRLEEILGGPHAIPTGAVLSVGSLAGGFQLPGARPELLVLTDHEIFRRSRRLRRGRRFRGSVALESLSQLTPGDYVVHMDHGVGKFRGLERLEIGGESIESLSIEYASGEILRVPVYRLDLVERWVGETDQSIPPHVHKIGGKRWKQLRKKTEESIQRMATELLELYARRDLAEGFAFSPDTRWQKEMESSFLYEDTPDQRKASLDVKRDMEGPHPMDRLVCGDVGYGKTEVAIRAAFKAIQDGKQVAVLAPTTILVEQHRHTFDERLADYPVRIAALSRFRTPAEQATIISELAGGELDIVIGTHRLLSPDVEFRDLGLLVIDEEQRFGVRHKERLKELRESIDVLTLTATPIPRTLQLAMSGLRNLSLIRTPPRDRMPIVTFVLPWSDRILGDALARELDRGGQVYVLHNRVETIHTVARRIQELAPEARITVAHGQMSARELDEHMHRFVEGEADILVCTSIIENGLDVPNANTLIVDRADHFGLAQLYQIRGRVGRSDRRAYCYLVVPDQPSEEAEKRLRVLEHYTELGSGYSVALRDLELRGAGNLLGADQSGFAHAVGIDTYMRLLERTVTRLRDGEAEVAADDARPDVSLSGSALLPDEFVPDESQKLHLYRRLSRMSDAREVDGLREEIRDRFGPLPPEAERLLDGEEIRILGSRLGIERIFVRGREARLTFRPGKAPRLNALERPFSDRQISVQLRRMEPLSLILRQEGAEPLTPMLIQALDRLVASANEPGAARGS